MYVDNQNMKTNIWEKCFGLGGSDYQGMQNGKKSIKPTFLLITK